MKLESMKNDYILDFFCILLYKDIINYQMRYKMEAQLLKYEELLIYVLIILVGVLCVEEIIRLIKKIKGIPDKTYQIDVHIITIDADKKDER